MRPRRAVAIEFATAANNELGERHGEFRHHRKRLRCGARAGNPHVGPARCFDGRRSHALSLSRAKAQRGGVLVSTCDASQVAAGWSVPLTDESHSLPGSKSSTAPQAQKEILGHYFISAFVVS